MSARWWTLAVWALAAASAVFWGLKLFVKPPQAPAHAQLADTGTALRGDVTRVLGVEAPPPAAVQAAAEPPPDARFQLVGVVSPRSPRAAGEGVALIAVDGKPPKAFRIGSPVDGDTVLQAVHARGATLGPRGGAALVALNLPPPQAASTGVPAGLPGAAPVPTPGMPVPNGPGVPGLPGVPPQLSQPTFPQPQGPPPQPSPQPLQPVEQPGMPAQQRQ